MHRQPRRADGAARNAYEVRQALSGYRFRRRAHRDYSRVCLYGLWRAEFYARNFQVGHTLSLHQERSTSKLFAALSLVRWSPPTAMASAVSRGKDSELKRRFTSPGHLTRSGPIKRYSRLRSIYQANLGADLPAIRRLSCASWEHGRPRFHYLSKEP